MDDADEFLTRIVPAARHSRLAPYWNQIEKLRSRNCTLSQVCDFLRERGVQVTIAGLSKYITKRQREAVQEKERGDRATRQSETTTVTTPAVDATSGLKTQSGPSVTGNANPLRVLSGSRIPGQFDPVPQSKIEFD